MRRVLCNQGTYTGTTLVLINSRSKKIRMYCKYGNPNTGTDVTVRTGAVCVCLYASVGRERTSADWQGRRHGRALTDRSVSAYDMTVCM